MIYQHDFEKLDEFVRRKTNGDVNLLQSGQDVVLVKKGWPGCVKLSSRQLSENALNDLLKGWERDDWIMDVV